MYHCQADLGVILAVPRQVVAISSSSGHPHALHSALEDLQQDSRTALSKR
jgi:hypothetical protein